MEPVNGRNERVLKDRSKLIIGVLFIIIGFTVGLAGVIANQMETGALVQAEAFVKALADADKELASALAVGEAKFNLAGHQLQPVKLVGIQARWFDKGIHLRNGQNWARVLVVAEIQLPNGDYDVSGYIVEMVRVDGQWKVYLAEPDRNPAAVSSRAVSSAELTGVFKNYASAAASADWPRAASYLAGPARRAQEASKNILGPAGFFKEVLAVEAQILGQQKGVLPALVHYQVDGRPATVLVKFVSTQGGWKIGDIANVGG